MDRIKNLICFRCGTRYGLHEVVFRCKCGGPLDINYDYAQIKKKINRSFLEQKPNHWKYWPFYPVAQENKITLGEGGTALVKNNTYGVWFKDETTNPTGSFKDRGSAVEVMKALETGVTKTCCATTGNMGASVSAYCKKVNIQCKIFVVASAMSTKLVKIRRMADETVIVEGDYADACALAKREQERGIYMLGDFVYRREGEKSIAFEIADQLGWFEKKALEYVVAPIGSGTLISACWRAFNELKKIGLIKSLPRIVGVQAAGCAPVVHGLKTGKIKKVKKPKTIAAAIACGDPLDGELALEAIKFSRGFGILVSDDEIISAQALLHKEGWHVEPGGAAAFAGYLKERDRLGGKEVVVLLTGSLY